MGVDYTITMSQWQEEDALPPRYRFCLACNDEIWLSDSEETSEDMEEQLDDVVTHTMTRTVAYTGQKLLDIVNKKRKEQD